MNVINEWSKRHYTLGAGNDRPGCVDFEESAPWCMRPLEDRLLPNVKVQTVYKSTQSSGTILGEVVSAFTLDRRTGNMAINCQSDQDADKFAITRFMPRIKALPGVAAILPSGRHKMGNNYIFFPDNTFLVIQGPGENNAQSFTASTIWNDEPYLYAPGRILEFSNRVGAVWNGKVINTSVGAKGPGTDLDSLYVEGTQEEWHHRCLNPACGQLFVPTWWKTRYDKFLVQWDRSMEDGEKTNYARLAETVRLVCPFCGERHPDTRKVRKSLTAYDRAGYIASNPGGNPEKPSYRWNKISPWGYSLSSLVEKFIKALASKRTGDYEPIRKFVMMDMAETYNRMDHESFGAELTRPTGDYSLSDVHSEEFVRQFPLAIGGFDKQDGANQRIEGVIRRFGRMADGSFGSRLVWTGTEDDEAKVAARAGTYGILPGMAGEDCAWRPDDVYAACLKHQWIALIGGTRENWAHGPSGIHKAPTTRPYSPGERERGVWRVAWSNPRIKGILLNKRTKQGMKDEHGKTEVEYWGLPSDAPNAYLVQINQRPIRLPDGSDKWPENAQDHRHDCECMIEAIWQMYLDGMYPHAPKL